MVLHHSAIAVNLKDLSRYFSREVTESYNQQQYRSRARQGRELIKLGCIFMQMTPVGDGAPSCGILGNCAEELP